LKEVKAKIDSLTPEQKRRLENRTESISHKRMKEDQTKREKQKKLDRLKNKRHLKAESILKRPQSATTED